MREAVIVEAVRTPIGKGKPGGGLSGWHPVDLLAETLRALVDRSGIDPEQIDDVITGCVSQAGQQAFNVGATRCSQPACRSRCPQPPSTDSAAPRSSPCTSLHRA